jgi:hypothetical protein
MTYISDRNRDAPGLLIIGQVTALGSNLCWLNEPAAVGAAA